MELCTSCTRLYVLYVLNFHVVLWLCTCVYHIASVRVYLRSCVPMYLCTYVCTYVGMYVHMGGCQNYGPFLGP